MLKKKDHAILWDKEIKREKYMVETTYIYMYWKLENY